MSFYQVGSKQLLSLVNNYKKFVTIHTVNFDASHNVEHATCVYNNIWYIIESLPHSVVIDWDIVATSAYLHDVSASSSLKYLNSCGEATLQEFVTSQIGEEKCKRVMKIIDNVSCSKEIKGLRETLPYPDNFYLDIISDADKLDAIGTRGIERCKTFVNARGGMMPEDVIKHCYDKLLRLYPDFFRTTAAKILAKPLNEEVLQYVKKIEPALKGIPLGIYKHYKSTSSSPKLYDVKGIMRNGSEIDEFYVRYRPLYQSSSFPKETEFCRKFEEFTDNVIIDGKSVPRFTKLDNEEFNLYYEEEKVSPIPY